MNDSFGSILSARKGEGKGFAVLRLVLALAIFIMHARRLAGTDPSAWATFAVTGHGDAGTAVGWEGISRPVYVALVPAFFALSGFLVSGSALRLQRVPTFLAFRFLRIFPALATEVTLSAILLGVTFTTLPLGSYFTDPEFWRYFGNIFGLITFTLPGVFETHRLNIVNGNLWTLPSEFDCYLITALLMATTLFYRRLMFTIALVVASIVFISMNTMTDFAVTQFFYSQTTITYYFFVGVAFYHWRSAIPARWSIFFVSAVIAYALMISRHTIFLAPVFLVYCTVFLGTVALPEFAWLKTRDYSYGIYLLGYPVIQATLGAFVFTRGHWLLALVISLTLTVAIAAGSWTYIERPTLALKARLPKRWFPGPQSQATRLGKKPLDTKELKIAG